MKLVRGAWRILVGIKDALVLVAMLLFFGLLYAALSTSDTRRVGSGALVVKLDGSVVEQPAETDPFAGSLPFAGPVLRQHRLRDVVHALDTARTDDRVKAVVLDLDRFTGGYPAALHELSQAIGRVRAGGKPVLAFATGYTDAGYLLAASASEIWTDPMGGALFTGPGGSQLYYKGLFDRLGVTAHIYRVGKYKSAVEPYFLTGQSPEAREESAALYNSLWGQWQEAVVKARPKAQLAGFVAQPAQAIVAQGGDISRANLTAGLVDKIGDRIAFNTRVAQLVGADSKDTALPFKAIKLPEWIADNPRPTAGKAIGVVTVAGTIVDGEAGSGTAAGDTIAKLILDGLRDKDLKALVVRVDSPGGSAMASERIRQAVLVAKRRGLPVVVSMGSLAASGGYWVATAGDTVFAEPATITGSIGIFGFFPTFETALAKIGITSDGVRTTPLSGQPDVFAGTNPVVDTVLQSGVNNGYARFIALVAKARGMTPQRVHEIAQGRVWDGGTARQLKLVDRFGGLDDAVAEAARRAKLDSGAVHALYLEKPAGWLSQFASTFDSSDAADNARLDIYSRVAASRQAQLGQAIDDLRQIAAGPAIQVRCLACAGLGPDAAPVKPASLIDLLMARLTG